MQPRTRIVLVLAVLLVAGPACLGADPPPAAPPEGARPTLTVEASYPGARAQVIAEAVAPPLEQQINGAEGLVSIATRCFEGTCRLKLTFTPTTDLNLTQVLVQNRVQLALPALPDLVRQAGVA